MITLRRGDRLPTVAVAQNYLNQHGASSDHIAVDGIFGRQTRGAVRNFESANGLVRNGIISGQNWAQIVGSGWQVIDSVDLTDFDDPRHAITDDEDLRPYRQTIVRNYGQSSGSPGVLREIQAQAQMGKVVLLRFHGHGGPGNMIVASGRDGDMGSSLNSRYGDGFYTALRAALKPIFAPFGSIEMHGCRVARGRTGRALLTGMADALGVPVSASARSQYGGGSSTFRFEGRPVTVCPTGTSLKEWARETCQMSIDPARPQ